MKRFKKKSHRHSHTPVHMYLCAFGEKLDVGTFEIDCFLLKNAKFTFFGRVK